MSNVKTEDFHERQIDIEGWPVKLTSYKVGDNYVCQADNVSPGATLARISAPTAAEAESQAISKAGHLLSKTKRQQI